MIKLHLLYGKCGVELFKSFAFALNLHVFGVGLIYAVQKKK